MSAGDKKVLANVIRNMQKREVDPLTPLVDRYLIERVQPKNRSKRITNWSIDLKDVVRPLGRISPSSVGGCERQAVFKFLGTEGVHTVKPETQMIFEDGHWRHHKWQAMFTEMEAILGPDTFQCLSIEERVTHKELHIAGALDAHIAIFDRGEMVDWVVDIKGINKWGFADVYSAQEPKEAHVKQLISYMRARRVRRGMILYDCKDDQRTKVFTIKFSSREWAEVAEWCERVIDAVDQQRLPPMDSECNKGTFLYEKCPYRRLCYGSQTAAEVERETFISAPSVKALWREGLRLEKEG